MGKKTKVVIDTNVIVSASGWEGGPEEILLVLKSEKKIEICASADFIEKWSKKL